MLIPTSKRGVKAFCGFASFYRKFIRNHSTLIKPLTDLFKTDVRFTWGTEQQTAFETIKQKLVEAPILKFPDLEKQFILTTDASTAAIGAVLSQKSDDNFLHPIAYASNVLSKTQQKWSFITAKDLQCPVSRYSISCS